MNTFLAAPSSRPSPVGDCVATTKNPMAVMLSAAKHLAFSVTSEDEILRLLPQDGIARQSLEGEGVYGHRAAATNIFLSVFAIIVLFAISAHGAETGKEKIAFAYAAISPTMAGVWMAKEIGAFDRQGLNVD